MTAPALLYLLVCRQCGNGDLVIPFDSPEARGKWAAAHRDSTGHDQWRCAEGNPGTAVLNEPSSPEPSQPREECTEACWQIPAGAKR